VYTDESDKNVTNWKVIKQELLKSFRKRLPPVDRKPVREFRSPEGYLDHEYLHCLKQMSFFEVEKNEIWRGLSMAVLGLQDLEIDPYYVTSDILRYLVNTDLPSATQAYQEVSPFLELVIPTGELVDDEGDSIVLLIVIDYFLWKEMARDELLQSIWEDEKTLYRYGIYALCEHGAVFYAPVLNDKELDATATGETVIRNGVVDNVLQVVKLIGLNLMILLKEYPEYITVQSSGKLHGSSGFGGKPKVSKPTKYSPKIIGADFNTKVSTEQTVIQAPTQAGGSTKKSTKRPHFRRGHWRRQRKGTRLVNHEYVWIKPVFIG